MNKQEYAEVIRIRERNCCIHNLEHLVQCINDTISDLQKDKITVEEIPECYKQFTNEIKDKEYNDLITYNRGVNNENKRIY